MLADLGKRLEVLAAVDGDADDVGAGSFEELDLMDGGLYVPGTGCGHALDGDRMPRTDSDSADANGAGGIAFYLAHGLH